MDDQRYLAKPDNGEIWPMRHTMCPGLLGFRHAQLLLAEERKYVRAVGMNFGMSIIVRGDAAGPATFDAMAEKAEALEFDTLWASDHLIMPPNELRLRFFLNHLI